MNSCTSLLSIMTDRQYIELTVASNLEEVRGVENQILSAAGDIGFNAADMFAIRLCLEEALTNAVRHGNGGDNSKLVKVKYFLSQALLEIFVEDQGKGFNPGDVPDPRSQENISRPGGRGLLLMNAYLDQLDYLGRGNIVRMIKKRSV
ncbi:MAG: ATP-binding protein [Sedimentisphaerales bacterium]|nr:ATP-binding protein [Sedimentisphaerales bacterium]